MKEEKEERGRERLKGNGRKGRVNLIDLFNHIIFIERLLRFRPRVR